MYPRKNAKAFHNGSNSDYYFIIKEIGEEFEKQFTCLGKNTEKYIMVIMNIFYILQFIGSVRFMTSSLSNLLNNVPEWINRIKRKYWHNDRKCIKYKYCDCIFEYTNFKDDLIEYNCLCRNKNYQGEFDEKLTQQFLNRYKFSSHDNNKFVLSLQKDKYMDDSEKLNETSLPRKEAF